MGTFSFRKKKQIETYFSKKSKVLVWYDSRFVTSRNTVVNFFESCKQAEVVLEKIFLDNKCPVFIISPDSGHRGEILFHGAAEISIKFQNCVKIVPNKLYKYMLRDFHFYNIMQPFQAFQEIHMYISGVLGFNNPVIPEIDDKIMRDIKGFNDMSFKKEPRKNK